MAQGTLLSMITGNQPFRTTLRDQDDKSDLLLVDATLKIMPEYESEPTELPVESGVDVTDHIRVKPIRISVTGIMSETPINLSSQLAGLVTSAGSLAGGLLGGFGPSVGAVAAGQLGASLFSSGDANTNPAIACRMALEKIILNKTIFTVIDKYRKYQTMVMTSLSFPKDPNTGHKLEFSFTARQIILVTAKETKITKIWSGAAGTVSKTSKRGSQTGATDTSGNGTVLFKGLKGLGF
jgi:hypothetical protein